MPQLNNNETYLVRGDMDVSSGTLTLRAGQINRSNLVQEDDSLFGVALDALKVWDDLNANLPGTAASDDLGIIEGTWGTDAPTVQSSDAKATTVTQRARVQPQ